MNLWHLLISGHIQGRIQGHESRAIDPATITSKAKAKVVLAFDKAKSTILVIRQTGKLFVPSRHFLQIPDQAQ